MRIHDEVRNQTLQPAILEETIDRAANSLPSSREFAAMRFSGTKRYKIAIGLMKPAIRSAWEILRLSTASRRPADDENPLAVVVHSFDGYKRFWPAARYFTERAIPSRFPIYYMSERIPMHPDPAKCILTGEGGFSTRLARGLDLISRTHKYILYLQEDIWLNEPLLDEDLSNFIQTMEENEMDCLKLGWGILNATEVQQIANETECLSKSNNVRWYGPHNYSMSHHCSIFCSVHFWRTAILAHLFRQERPLRNEIFLSETLKNQIKARDSDRKRIRVAVWETAPVVSFTHACISGRLTPEGRGLLEKHRILHFYDEGLPGEILPLIGDLPLMSGNRARPCR